MRTASRPRLEGASLDGVLMLAAAFALRCWWFGNPVVQVDEQFYLLVGDRLLHGALPFVDIWDRKPIGLFLVYAAIRLLGGSGIVEYQIVATGCAAVAALLIVRMARLCASETAARIAGVVSLLWLIVFDGAGGQSPIFYNPLIAGAATLTLGAFRSGDPKRIGRAGAGAMLLAGLAIQIKYTALFEGVGFGLVLLWSVWRSGIRRARLAGLALSWVTIALTPTALALAYYAGRDHGGAFVFANFLSVGQRGSVPLPQLAGRLANIAAMASPMVAAACWAFGAPYRDQAAKDVRRFVLVWLAAALAGLVAIGAFYTHYFLPMIVPLSLACAPAFDRVARWGGTRAWRPALLLLPIGAILAASVSLTRLHKRGDGQAVDAVVRAIQPRLDGCLFVFDGEPILYQMTHACLVSHYAFPGHLNERKEAAAIGADPVREVEHAMDARPDVVITSDRPAKDGNLATWAVMRHRLSHDYALVAAVPIYHRLRLVYQRRVAG
ncbi:ArnT family glycosyltransferase [Sphingomonas bacterium]|uniref:ArnT family glycosyltransferase n=1 Tax=Sphingomonas bacterium TaxID=1895847 RepID=UPI00157735D7|nr:glycosyltransferase family 39 protein [Sphingomonas bacterium]